MGLILDLILEPEPELGLKLELAAGFELDHPEPGLISRTGTGTWFKFFQKPNQNQTLGFHFFVETEPELL